MDLEKDWLKLVTTLLAVTTAFGLFVEFVPHDWQMYALSALVVYHLWFEK